MLINLSNIRNDPTMDTPASAMTRGLAVKKSSATIALAGAGDRPYGFLGTEVTTDGLSWLELETLPHAQVEENKVSEGKVIVILWEPGDIATDNIKSGESWAVGEKVAVTANGVLTVDAAAQNDVYIGIVKAVDQTYGAQIGTMAVITLSQDLGLVP